MKVCCCCCCFGGERRGETCCIFVVRLGERERKIAVQYYIFAGMGGGRHLVPYFLEGGRDGRGIDR